MIAVVLAVTLAFVTHPTSTPPKLVHFKSPSGNINCLGQKGFSGTPTFVECSIKASTWSAKPKRPRTCDLDWDPYTLELANRKLYVGSCRGDIGPLCIDPANPCSTLAYGQSVDIGPIRCMSATGGVTCRYRTARRVGFRIAREAYRLYSS